MATDGQQLNVRKRAGERVNARRNELGFRSQQALADAANVSRDRVNKLENGERISLNLMSRVENVLQWEPGSLDRLFGGGEPAIKGVAENSSASEGAHIDVAKASTEELASLFMDLAKDHSDAEVMEAMAQVIKVRSQDAASRDVS